MFENKFVKDFVSSQIISSTGKLQFSPPLSSWWAFTHFIRVHPPGIEPGTVSLKGSCSTI